MALSLGVILAFVLIITLPFSGQALHVDDALFWDFAKNNLDHPFQQHLANYHLMGEDVAAFRDTHPPIDELYQSLIMWISGSTDLETPLHLGFIFFPLVTGISMFFLARRFVKNALLATLLMLATPAVMVMSHNLMGDLPMTAFWLAATTVYIYGADRGDWRLLGASSLLITLAVFTGYQALALILMLPLYSLITGKLQVKTVAPVVLPAVAFALFSWYNLATYGALPRFSHARGLSMEQGHVLSRLQGLFLQVGGASVSPLFMTALFSLKRKRFLLLPLVAGGAAALALYHHSADRYPWATTVLFAVFFTATAMMLLMIITETAAQLSRRVKQRLVDTDFLFLGLWLVTILVATALLLPHATAKYYLPFFAPLILLLFKETEAKVKSQFAVRTLLGLAIALTFITGTAVSAADFQYAQAYKDYALSLGDRYHPQGNVWFVGEWGFRHYMESKGYKYLTSTDTSPAEGDLIVQPMFMEWPLAPSLTSRMHLIEITDVQWSVPIRVMNFEGSAGFYGSYWGLLPYTFTSLPLEKFKIYQVGPDNFKPAPSL